MPEQAALTRNLTDMHTPADWPVNETIEKLLQHRTIRAFADEPVEASTIAMLAEVCNRTATSTGMQQASWIRVTDKSLAREIAAVCKQDYVAEAAELWIFAADCYRNSRLADSHDSDGMGANDMNRLTQAWTDAVLCAQNLTTAVESLGYGAVYLGSILNDPAKIIDLLQLPKLTFPVLGVAFGRAAQSPQFKPRMPVDLRTFENRYEAPADYAAAFADYDQVMTQYYDLRNSNRRLDSFSSQVCQRLADKSPRRARILQDIAAQGFDLKAEG